jgi:hypothetical protein
MKTLWLAMSRCISSRSGKPAPRQLSSRCCRPIPRSCDVIPRLGDVIPMSGDVIPRLGDVIAMPGDVIPASGDVIPGSGDVIPRSGDVIPSGSSSTRGQPAQANRWRQCRGMLDNPAACGICTTNKARLAGLQSRTF